jgi:hypothetical protein
MHNRIRTSELSGVMIPVPHGGTEPARVLERIAHQFRSSLEALSRHVIAIAKLRAQEAAVIRSS